ncbi:MAG: glycoside hydrolase family 2, partial [Clostridia bacterium]|nr:glycoside hydrolase family 2 [Clostridia bacterium]
MKELYTKAGENLSGTPWNVYPRPQLKRDSFYCLNGEWEFAVTDGEAPAAYDRKILVPFAPESLLSGV